MTRYSVTPNARADLHTIWEYIAADNVEAADRVIGEIEAAFVKLSEMPGIGHYREDLLDRRYKFWSVRSYVIAYRWETDPIQVIGVVHGSRKLDAFLYRRAT